MKFKNIITVCAFFLLIILGSNKLVAQTASPDSVAAAEIKLKQKQAEQLKEQCPHYPSASTTGAGMNSSFDAAYKKWINDYPAEYEAYKKIFNY